MRDISSRKTGSPLHTCLRTKSRYITAVVRFALPFLAAGVCACAGSVPAAHAGEDPRTMEVIVPVYISEVDNINDFTLFANGGWDGNWYVGSNTCWIQKLTLPEQGDFTRAYVGAKMGRMKGESVKDKPSWIKKAIPGTIQAGVSAEPAWDNASTFFLTDTADIPLEGDPENAVNNVGESRWFWREIPLEKLNFGGENYIALWSSSIDLDSAQTAPILAATWGDKEMDTWLNDEIQGVPPKEARTSLKTSIAYFEPAIAIKLIPKNSYRVNVGMTVTRATDKEGDKTMITAFVIGANIEKAWVEYSKYRKQWEKISGYKYSAPYIFSVDGAAVPSGKYFIRAVAVDELGNRGESESVQITFLRSD